MTTHRTAKRRPSVYLHFIAEVLLTFFLFARQVLAEAPPNDDVDVAISKISKAYAVDIPRAFQFPVDGVQGEISARMPTKEHVKSYLPIFASEWNLYPPELVKRAGVWRVVLCEWLTYGHQERGGIPRYYANELYFDVNPDRFNELRFRKGIHHEFFHMIDHADDGLVSDSQWECLNPKSFRYGRGGEYAQQDYSSGLIDLDLAGFLNRYSKTAAREDKAEMFCYMMVNGKEVEQRASEDSVIRAKMLRMKQMLKEFCPDVDEQFWQAARGVSRPSDWPARIIAVPAASMLEQRSSATRSSQWLAERRQFAAAFVVLLLSSAATHRRWRLPRSKWNQVPR